MKTPGPILMFGKDALLLETRSRVLKAAGFVSTPVATLAGFQDALMQGGWQVLILCHTLSETDCKVVLSLVAAHAPEIPIVTLESGFSTCAIASVQSVDVLSGPKNLIAKVDSLLHPLFDTNNQVGPRRSACRST